MNIFFNRLELRCKQADISVPFQMFTCFYGKIGSGKSTIADLIDYCLGSDLELSPALQREFVSAVLFLTVNDIPLRLERPRDSDNVIAEWQTGQEKFELVVPSRNASGVVLQDTEVEVLSDMIFYLLGHKPPKVRKSKTREDSALNRLSLRNILWYCYIDQPKIDSSFFNLDRDADPFRRNASRDVLRFVIGFHQELVSELESQLQEIRERRVQKPVLQKLFKRH
jgi:hypothetical protein